MKYLAFLTVTIVSFSAAQETCRSLLSGVEQTLNNTQTLTRATNAKLGFIELMSNTSIVKQSNGGLEVIVVEKTGITPPQPPNESEAEEGWLGFMTLSDLSCESHQLQTPNDNEYTLELVGDNPDSPMQSLALDIFKAGEDYFLDSMRAKMQGPSMPVTANITTTFSDWLLLD